MRRHSFRLRVGFGAGRGRSLRVALVCAGVAVAGPVGVGAQGSVLDSYSLGGASKNLRLRLDSVVLQRAVGVVVSDLDAVVLPRLQGAVLIRTLGASRRVVVYGVQLTSRAQLATTVRQLSALPEVDWAGFVATSDDAREPAFVTPEFLVQFRPGVTPAQVGALNSAHGAAIVRAAGFPGDHYVLRVNRDGIDAVDMSQSYEREPTVEYAHPNFILWDETDALPSGAMAYEEQWHLHNSTYTATLSIRPDVHAWEAWTVTEGKPEIVIAIIDTGFDTEHPDLKDNAWQNPWEAGTLPGPDPLNKPGDQMGWSFQGCASPQNPLTSDCGTPDMDPTGSYSYHGTGVAAVVAASGAEGSGVRGVCPKCSIMYVRPGSQDYPYSSDVRAATVDYARVMGADVINASWHAPWAEATIRKAFVRAATFGRDGRGIPIVNVPSNIPSDSDWDFCGSGKWTHIAAMDSVIAVTRTDVNDVRQLGAKGKCLDLIAPGVAITTADPRGGDGKDPGDYWDQAQGNSYAAPMVAGTIGLMLSKNPALTFQEVYDVLTSTADKVDNGGYVGGFSETHGYGRVNAYRAVQKAASLLEPDGPWEVGVLAGLNIRDGTDHVTDTGVPGGGPLGEPVIYVSRVTSAFLLDGRVGYRRTKTSAASAVQTERSLALGIQAAYRLGGFYGGPTLAHQNVDTPGSSISAWGYGVALGYRYPFAQQLALRLEGSYRRWSSLSVDEWSAVVGMGVRF